MITSMQNNKVKQWNKLKKRKDRTGTHTFLIEGFHLIEEAHASDWEIVELILQDGIPVPDFLQEYAYYTVSQAVIQQISSTKTPQGIVAVVRMKEYKWGTFEKLLLVDSLQDPGNLGTMIRTADAAGFDAVILGDNTVDVYNEKVIRSTQGSIFHIPIFQENLVTKIPSLKREGFAIWASALTNASIYSELSPQPKTALIVGNEGAGISENVLNLADDVVKIPIYGKAESLNASIAAGILMYYLQS
ncbi:RNA methyltransferase [Lentibacillus sp. L22]|uniref:TrmH family RNA methyltransferase n=1 Tax=Lentibacillus TaxID=175304 RepID=UPI0022B0B65B|nr:RNA methyltransferase [Lentibacillus daqui]